MRLPILLLLSTVLSGSMAGAQLSSNSAKPTEGEALRLVKTLELPPAVKGNFDHFGIDLKRNRLFATPEDFKAVLVFDLAQGKVIHQIDAILRPHAILYRPDTDRLYVTDGGDGSVKVYDAETYKLLTRIPLLK